MRVWVKEGSSKARIAQRGGNHQGPALPCPGRADCPAPRPSGNPRGCYNLDSTPNTQIKRGIKWQPRIHPPRLHAPGLQIGYCVPDTQLLSFTIFALENLQMRMNEFPSSPGTPATAESAPELPFHPLHNCQSGKRSGKKAGGWDTGYVALYTNPTIVNAVINYPHGPLQQRELYRGDGEEC